MFFFGLIQEVDAQHHRPGDLQDLEDQGEVAFQAGSVGDDEGDVGLTGEDKIPGDFLLGGAGIKGVSPREVHEGIGTAAVCKDAVSGIHGFTGPVSGMLVEVSQGVKDGRFADVRVTHEGDDGGGAAGMRHA